MRWLVKQSESQEIISSPRDYQVELFERAKEKNIIAVLDTGSGKTLIAVLLLRHIIVKELDDRAAGKPNRISLFLVDSVPLAFQQYAVLDANLDYNMAMLHGDMKGNMNKDCWGKSIANNMAIVCTAEILAQALHRSFISMSQINLLIFDEAHHAKKNHPYARIIKDFYMSVCDSMIRPKIFGMTASPVDSRVDIRLAAAELEGLLHCEIATAADPSLMKHSVNTQVEEVAPYEPLGPSFKTRLLKRIIDKFGCNPLLKKPIGYALNATRELGAWCADQVWWFCLSDQEVQRLQAKAERCNLERRIPMPLMLIEQMKAQIKQLQETVQMHGFGNPHYDEITGTSTNLSSKVVVLLKYLKARFSRPTDDKCIVFVKQRYTARLLEKLFSQDHIGTPYLRVGTLVGTLRGAPGDSNVSFREQVLTLMHFRKGMVNCLFATSVAEEGLDIPDCNLVIRFDLYDTLIEYIQSRGRARHTNSRYVHMCEKGNVEHEYLLDEVRRNESVLKQFCAELPDDRKLLGSDFDMDYFLAKEKKHRVFIVEETGAKLTYGLSLKVLSNFVDSLPRSGAINHMPEYVITVRNKQFICEVLLPEGSPIRRALGKPASTKQVAKCSAAFEACIELRKGKYLDANLLPTFTKSLPAMRNAVLAVSNKQEAYTMRTKPLLWMINDGEEVLYLTVFTLGNADCLERSSQPIALLTRRPIPDLPSFLLHFGTGRNSPVNSITLDEPLKTESIILKQINAFTLIIFKDVFSKEYQPDHTVMPYFIVPIKSNIEISANSSAIELIDWGAIKLVDKYEVGPHFVGLPWDKNTPDAFFENKFVSDPFDGSRKFWTIGVSHKFKPLDPVPQNTAPRPGTRRNNDNIMEYSCSLWEKARARRTFRDDQPVVECELVSLRRNLLDEFDIIEDETPKKCYIIMEPMKISPLPTTIVAMAYLFPAIIHRVESYLIALDACALLHLEIRPDLALEAVTKDSDNTDSHGETQINFQRGMGNNYERLEFLGDSFLKMATSISLYSMLPENDEFRYHVDRMLLICNKNLRNNAIKLKLYEYIRSKSFNRRVWYPEGPVLLRGKNTAIQKSHRLSDKTIADVCEALIGAAFLAHRDSKDMDNAVRAVTELVCSDNHRAACYADYYKLYKMPAYQTAPATAAQRELASQVEMKHNYHFQYPRLLRSAFMHPSYPYVYEHIPSYQRLEFLGDALLDMVAVDFLFINHPTRDPQWLTEHKEAMVSNQFYGYLAIKLGFHKHLLYFHGDIQNQIRDYITEIEYCQSLAEEEAIRCGKSKKDISPDFWIDARRPPKCLPDVIEAYVGAIFVDSRYNYDEVQRFFNVHIAPFFQDMSLYDRFASKHPSTVLTRFLNDNMGCTNWRVYTKALPQINGEKNGVMCLLRIHEVVVCDGVAESGRYAKTKVCKAAMEILSGLPINEFREKHGCNCGDGDATLVPEAEKIGGNGN
ncbi:hypothetical protein F5884DRAFT_793130 [Xylogone sp. PMI_703]|nr:hypothetical protein F5884DRAFT_793130 [Xylogone sp. PMI_703]